jgi:hypothetical protein
MAYVEQAVVCTFPSSCCEKNEVETGEAKPINKPVKVKL